MLSYKTLVVVVLALSTTPAFSAPVSNNQQQARAAIEEEPESGGSDFVPGLLKNVGISAGLSVLDDAAKHFFGNRTRRDTELTLPTLHFFPVSNNGDLNASPTPQGSPVRFEQGAPGLEEAMKGPRSLDHSQREPLSERGLGKSALDFVASSFGSLPKHFLGHTRREPQPGKWLDDAVLTLLH